MSNQDQRSTHPELERLNEDMKGFKLFDVPSSTEPRKRAFVDTERMQQTWKGPFMQKGYLYLAAASLQELQSRRLQALQSARLNAALPTAPHVNYSYGTTHGDAKVLRGFIADGEEYLWRTAAASESFLVSKDYSLFNRKKTVQELASTLQGKDAVSREAQWMVAAYDQHCKDPSKQPTLNRWWPRSAAWLLYHALRLWANEWPTPPAQPLTQGSPPTQAFLSNVNQAYEAEATPSKQQEWKDLMKLAYYLTLASHEVEKVQIQAWALRTDLEHLVQQIKGPCKVQSDSLLHEIRELPKEARDPTIAFRNSALILLLRGLIHLSEVELQGALRDRVAPWSERVPMLKRALAFRQRPPAVKRPLYFKYGRVIDEGYAKELRHEVKSLNDIRKQEWGVIGIDQLKALKAKHPFLAGQFEKLMQAVPRFDAILQTYEFWHRDIKQFFEDGTRIVGRQLKTLPEVHKDLQEAKVCLPIEELIADIGEFHLAVTGWEVLA